MAEAISHDGLTIYFETAGCGAPLLIVNGFGPPCEWMARMYGRRFEDRSEYVVADLRDVSRSDVPTNIDALDLSDLARDHLAVFDALGWCRANVYGGSMGTSIAAELALLAPKRVASLARGNFDSGRPNVFCHAYCDIVETQIQYGQSILAQKTDPEGAARVLLETYFGDGRLDAADAERVGAVIVSMLRQYPMGTAFPPLKALAGLPADLDPLLDGLLESAEPLARADRPRRDFVMGDLWEEIDALRLPVLLVHGMKDWLIPYQSAVYAAPLIPNAELCLLASLHNSLSSAPQVLRDIGDWMLRHEASERR